MAVGAVRVRGLGELQRDLKRADRDIAKALRNELRAVAEPVRALAQSKAESEIPHIGASWARGGVRNAGALWARMRVGVTNRTVYVAPASRRHGGSPRPNLGTLLMDRAMQPALEEMEGEIVRRVERMLDTFGVDQGF